MPRKKKEAEGPAEAAFRLAGEVKEIANELIRKTHTHLAQVRIEYLFDLGQPMSGGKLRWGCCVKLTGRNAFLANEDEDGAPFFCVVITEIVWKHLKPKEREALVDHELSHAWRDEDGNLKLLPHDIEEFTGTFKRYGVWRPDIEKFLAAQPKFDFGTPGVVKPEAEKKKDRKADTSVDKALGKLASAKVQ